MGAGVALTLPDVLALVVVGVLVLTGGFFAAHATASGWTQVVGGRRPDRASALYVMAYYGGSSLFGALVAWPGGGGLARGRRRRRGARARRAAGGRPRRGAPAPRGGEGLSRAGVVDSRPCCPRRPPPCPSVPWSSPRPAGRRRRARRPHRLRPRGPLGHLAVPRRRDDRVGRHQPAGARGRGETPLSRARPASPSATSSAPTWSTCSWCSAWRRCWCPSTSTADPAHRPPRHDRRRRPAAGALPRPGAVDPRRRLADRVRRALPGGGRRAHRGPGLVGPRVAALAGSAPGETEAPAAPADGSSSGGRCCSCSSGCSSWGRLRAAGRRGRGRRRGAGGR